MPDIASLPNLRMLVQLSTLMVAAYEGVLIQSRVAGDAQPVKEVADLLVEWVRLEIQPKDRKDQV